MMLKSKLKLLIADDHPIMLNGLKNELLEIGYQHITLCKNGLQAYEELIENHYDVAILDIKMPELDGFGVSQKCKENHCFTPIILYSYHKEKSYLSIAKKIGIKGYMLKEDTIDDLHECIISVLNDQTYYSKSIENSIFTHLQKDLQSIESLTASEINILKMIVKGMSSQEMSDQRKISIRTVEKHRANIISKLGIDVNLRSLKSWAMENKQLIESL